MALRTDILHRGGLAATHELLRSGHSQSRLRSAVASGEILRVRKGWYAVPDLPLAVQRAARVGGRLTCVSAAVEAGLWVPHHLARLHVAVSPNACQLRAAGNFRARLGRGDPVVVHWDDVPDTRLEVPPAVVIAEVCRCQPPNFAFVVCESALHRGYLSWPEWQRVLESLPSATARALSEVDHLSESGTESMFKRGMLTAGIPFRQQIRLGRDCVDFLVGKRLVVEIDSRAHHDPTADCERDARLSILGFRVLRFIYTQITDDWPTVLASVQAAIARGDHLT
jgi:very-short-patch-repair endonuclease